MFSGISLMGNVISQNNTTYKIKNNNVVFNTSFN